MKLSEYSELSLGASDFSPGKAWLNVKQHPYSVEVRLTPCQLMRFASQCQRLAFKLSEKKRGKR